MLKSYNREIDVSSKLINKYLISNFFFLFAFKTPFIKYFEKVHRTNVLIKKVFTKSNLRKKKCIHYNIQLIELVSLFFQENPD